MLYLKIEASFTFWSQYYTNSHRDMNLCIRHAGSRWLLSSMYRLRSAFSRHGSLQSGSFLWTRRRGFVFVIRLVAHLPTSGTWTQNWSWCFPKLLQFSHQTGEARLLGSSRETWLVECWKFFSFEMKLFLCPCHPLSPPLLLRRILCTDD